MNADLAQRLYELRTRNGYSQDELARLIGISRQAISKWERAESIPDIENLLALARLYDVTVDEIMGGSRKAQGETERAEGKLRGGAAKENVHADGDSSVGSADDAHAGNANLADENTRTGAADLADENAGAEGADPDAGANPDAGADPGESERLREDASSEQIASSRTTEEASADDGSTIVPGGFLAGDARAIDASQSFAGETPHEHATQALSASEACDQRQSAPDAPSARPGAAARPSSRAQGASARRNTLIAAVAAALVLVAALLSAGSHLQMPADNAEVPEAPAVPAAPEAPDVPEAGSYGAAWTLGGDAFCAGQDVVVPERTDHNLFAAGHSVSGAGAAVGSDAFVTGQSVSIAAWNVSNALFVAGENISVNRGDGTSAARVLLAAGRTVFVDGIYENAYVSGQTVILAGTFSGDVHVSAETVVIRETAVIDGVLYASAAEEPRILQGAQVDEMQFEQEGDSDMLFSTAQGAFDVADAAASLLGLLATAALLLLLLGDAPASGAGTIVRTRPVRTALCGLAALLALPVSAGLLLITLVGMRAALVCVLAFVALCALCTAFASIVTARMLLPHWNRWASGLAGAAVFSLASTVPVLGPVVWLGSFVLTAGCAVGAFWDWRRGNQAAKGQMESA